MLGVADPIPVMSFLKAGARYRADLAPAEDEDPRSDRDVPWRVLLHNDDRTPIEYVARKLHQVFALSWTRALWVTLRTHNSPVPHLVVVLPRREAEEGVRRIVSEARADGWPLLLTCEPAD